MFKNTWQNFLLENGVDPQIATTLLGFTLWKKNEDLASLGKKLDAILATVDEKPIIKDVIGSDSDHIGLLFLNKPISEDDATKIFNIIIGYEKTFAANDKCS